MCYSYDIVIQQRNSGELMKRKFIKTVLLISVIASSLLTCSCNKPNDGGKIAEVTVASSFADYSYNNESSTTSLNISANSQQNSGVFDKSIGLDLDNFVREGNFITYNGDELTPVQGTDISSYSGQVDFGALKESGIDFVMVRLGGRGYGESGALYADDFALSNIKSAKSAGLKVGAYFFSQAISEEEAKEEADYASEILQGEALDFPVAFDWETIEGESARTDSVDNSTLTGFAKAFCEEIKSKGYTPMIYAKSAVFERYNLDSLENIDFWYAEYADIPSVTKGYTMWQYSESAELDGISGGADLNLCFVEY